MITKDVNGFKLEYDENTKEGRLIKKDEVIEFKYIDRQTMHLNEFLETEIIERILKILS